MAENWLIDKSSFNHTLTPDATVSLDTVNVGPLGGDGAAYFAGTAGNKILINGADEFNIGPVFTLELEFRVDTSRADTTTGLLQRANGAGSSWDLFTSSSNLFLRLTAADLNQTTYFFDMGFVKGTRYRIAVTRDSSGYVRFFRNGTLVRTDTTAGPSSLLALSGEPIRIGTRFGNEGSYSHKGQIDEVRITKGVCRYTASYTPAVFKTGAEDPNWSNVVLLSSFNSTDVDLSANAARPQVFVCT